MTNTQHKIITTACIILASISICSGADRVFDKVWDASVGFSQQMDVQFFQAESIDYTHRARYGSAPIILTNAGQVVVWEVMGKSGTAKQTNSFLVSTGIVQSAAGVMKFSVSPAQANLSTGFYTGYVRSFIKTGTNIDHNLVLAYQNITVDWSPASSNYTLVAALPAPEWYAYTNAMQSASGTLQRVINKSARIEDGASSVQDVQWFQAESVRLNESITQNGSPFDMRGTNTVFVWEVTGLKYTNVFIAAAGGAVNAAAGQLRFELAPEDSNLLPGKYLGFVRSMQQGVSNTLGGGVVLAVQTITVQGSPDSRYYPIRGPLTYSIEFSNEALTNYFWTVLGQTRTDLTNLTERTGRIESRTNDWNAAFGWGSHAGLYPLLGVYAGATQGLWSALGLKASQADVSDVSDRLRVETNRAAQAEALLAEYTNRAATALQVESDPAWHSGTGGLWSAIGGKQPAGDYATGTPLYVESDPAWHGGTGAVWGAINGKQPAGDYATGTPLYVESDPAWHGGTGAVWGAITALEQRPVSDTNLAITVSNLTTAFTNYANTVVNPGFQAVQASASNAQTVASNGYALAVIASNSAAQAQSDAESVTEAFAAVLPNPVGSSVETLLGTFYYSGMTNSRPFYTNEGQIVLFYDGSSWLAGEESQITENTYYPPKSSVWSTGVFVQNVLTPADDAVQAHLIRAIRADTVDGVGKGRNAAGNFGLLDLNENFPAGYMAAAESDGYYPSVTSCIGIYAGQGANHIYSTFVGDRAGAFSGQGVSRRQNCTIIGDSAGAYSTLDFSTVIGRKAGLSATGVNLLIFDQFLSNDEEAGLDITNSTFYFSADSKELLLGRPSGTMQVRGQNIITGTIVTNLVQQKNTNGFLTNVVLQGVIGRIIQ